MQTMAKGGSSSTDMPLDVFKRSLEFLIDSNIHEARLLGGEPTLHHEFARIIDLALDRGLRLLIFTGGLLPKRALERIERIAADRISVLVNVISPVEGNISLLNKQAKLYRRLGRRVILGVNIDSPAISLEFLLDLIDKYHLAPSVRLGLAHPVLGGKNTFLHPRCYPEVGRRVADFGVTAAERGVQISFDCGWVPCMFPEGGLQALVKTPAEVGLRCNPILDLMPDGRVISCYPLANHGAEGVSEKTTATELRSRFAKRQASDRVFCIYKKCMSCQWRKYGACTGGCLAGALRRIRRSDFSFSMGI